MSVCESLGARIRALRCARHIDPLGLRLQRGTLCRVELGQMIPSVGYLERIAAALDTSPWRFFLPAEEFEARLALEDSFVLAVKPFLKSLSAQQKTYILKVLAAAPVTPQDGRRRRR